MYPSERATPGFQRGYRDCRDGRKQLFVVRAGDFYTTDYIDGYEACFNEQYWNAVRENKHRDQDYARDWDEKLKASSR